LKFPPQDVITIEEQWLTPYNLDQVLKF